MSKLKVAINGFGRIGRLALRQALKRDDMEIVAINDLADDAALVYLFERDSVHGNYKKGEVGYADGALEALGKSIPMTSHRDPAEAGWGDKGVDVVLECTGVFTKRERAQLHLDAGAKRVLISAPATNPDVTVCLGVNDGAYDAAKHRIVSNASCTTNCVSPVLKALDDAFGVEYGVLNTVHAYTMGQSLLDAPADKLRRGRAAALNLVPTSTGAAKAVGLVLPQLAGRLDGFAIRTPNPTGSMADLTLLLKKDASVADVHGALRSYEEQHPTILEVSDAELVSSDIVGDTHSSIVDSLMTMKLGPMLKLVAWYDNEFGYATRLVEMAAFIGKGR